MSIGAPVSSQIIFLEQKLERISERIECVRRAVAFLDQVRALGAEAPLGAERDARQYVEEAARELLKESL